VTKFESDDEDTCKVDAKKLNGKSNLFEDDAEDDKSIEGVFNSKIAAVHSKAGQKVQRESFFHLCTLNMFKVFIQLLELQTKYGGDQRFHLSEKFLDQDQVDQNGEPKQENLGSEEENSSTVRHEKSRHLNILENVLGKSISSAKHDEISQPVLPEKAHNKFHSSKPMIRFAYITESILIILANFIAKIQIRSRKPNTLPIQEIYRFQSNQR